MAVVQLLQVLLTLLVFVANVSAGTNVNRQLDIPAYKEFFSQVSPQRTKDDETTKTGISAVVSRESEGFKPPLPVTSNMEVNNTSSTTGEDLNPQHNSNSGRELNDATISSAPEFRNVSGYQQTAFGLITGGFSPSVQVPQTISETEAHNFEFNPVFKSSSHGSILFNSPTPGVTTNKNTVLGEKSESFQPTKPFSIIPLHLRTAVPSTNHSTSSSEIHSSKAASARAIAFQGFTNSHTVQSKTANANDWIPISAPIQFPDTSFGSQTVTGKPPSSNGLVFQPTSNSSALTQKKEEDYKNENVKDEVKGQVELGSSLATDTNGTIGVVDNDSNPSFLRGISFSSFFRKPSEPLYGQVLYPSKKYPPARRPVTKPVYKAPASVNQISNGAGGAYSSAQPARYPVHQPTHRPVHHPTHRPVHHPTQPTIQQPTYQPTHQPVHPSTYQPVHQPNPPPPSNVQFTPLVNLYPATVNSGHTVSENSLYGKGYDREVANVGYPNPFPPSQNEVANVGYSNPFSPINPESPVLGQLNGSGYGNSPPSSVQTNFKDGYTDDIGTVSSFSYFRHLESGPKGFDNAFSIHAGRNIAKQFHQNMFDQTGFPGNGQGTHISNERGIGGGKY